MRAAVISSSWLPLAGGRLDAAFWLEVCERLTARGISPDTAPPSLVHIISTGTRAQINAAIEEVYLDADAAHAKAADLRKQAAELERTARELEAMPKRLRIEPKRTNL